MYHINRKVDKPDVGHMEFIVNKLMERGIKLADCTKLRNYYANLREELRAEFQTKYGVSNPNSAQQITWYLENLSRSINLSSKNDIINICYNDETGKWTSNADAMEKLADLGYEFAQDLLDYRHAKKYAESIESVMDAADENGLVHPTVTLGKTHRINYSKPGIMTIPKKLLWHMIEPFKQGNILYSVDIKNQEPNILINMTNAEELKFALESEDGLYETMFKRCFQPTATANILVDTLPENRVYTIPEIKKLGTISPAMYSAVRPATNNLYVNGKKIIGIETICAGSEKGVMIELPDTVDVELEDGSFAKLPVEWESAEKKCKRSNDYSLIGKLSGADVEISKAERKEFKQSWLALSYGASVFGIKQMCKTIDGTRVYNYITSIEAIKEYRKQIEKYAKQGNTGICTIFGTPMSAGVDTDDWKKLRRVLLDLPIQGSGADILSLLIKHFFEYTEEHGLADKMILYYTRHDELIIEVDGEWVNEVGDEHVCEVLKDMLEHQIDDWTPFKVEISQTHADKLGLDFEED